jgi:hypothetical protein
VLSEGEIGVQLFLGEGTVRTHVTPYEWGLIRPGA